MCHLGRRQCAGPPPYPARLSRCRKARLRPLADQPALELCERPHDLKHGAARYAAGVYVLGEAAKVRALPLDPLHDLQQVGKRSGKPIKFPDRERVAVVQRL